jgi:hypothetical protein
MVTTATLDEVWDLFREVSEARKETNRRLQEADWLMEKRSKEND